MRKFIIGIVSLAVVLGVFVLYSRIDKTPPLNTNTGPGFIGNPAENDINDLESAIGKVSTSQGNVGIGPTKNFEYITRNEEGEIEQKFGFQKLLHTEGDLWELEKPYINIYHKEFISYMKADAGIVLVEKIGDKTIPKDATFSGNVVINILPGSLQSVEESTIYLDNLSFISEKSQLSTDDNLEFVSKNVHMSGVGMELIYNDEMERLEYFRIIDLDSLNVKIRRKTLGTMSTTSAPYKTKNIENSTEKPPETADSNKPTQSQDEYYTCLFSKNILIDTPDQCIFAEQEIEIDDIIFSREMQDGNKPGEPVSYEEPNELNIIAEEPNVHEDLVDVVITCDNGFILVPKNSGKINDFRDSAKTISGIEKPEITEGEEKTMLSTQKIQLTTLEGDSVAVGPTELIFYIEDLNNPDPNLRSFPVTITSQKGAQFIKAANQVVFEGDAFCSIPQNDLSEKRNAALASPMLIINLPENKPEQKKALPDIIAIGPAELLFYVEDPNASPESQKIIPVKITAQEKALYLPAMNQVIFDRDCLCQIGSEETGKQQFVSLKSSNLKIDLPKDKNTQSFAFSDITAAGPVDLKFFMKDPNNMGKPQSLLPVNITAQKYARYMSSSRQIVVDGSCKNSMLREDKDFIQELTLLAEKITVDLPQDINNQEPSSTLTEIRHLNADSNQVILTVTKKVKDAAVSNPPPDQILGWTKLMCRSLDYDTQEQVFQATGPGELTLSDIEIRDSNEPGVSKILGKKWWAVIYGFSDLKYLLSNNRIIANAEPEKTINIQYIEEKNTELSPVIVASAGHIEIELRETEENKLEPSIIVASGGIDYKKDADNRFRGSVLIYDHEKGTIIIRGDDKNPAFYNTMLVDEIRIDLINDKIESIEAKISRPGSL
ncbi:MAG: LPS export ABC transporter periplasmic protein LptC [Sedimentisphaerales bacterium]|nr:LPS export ABC transporter periplasmic protein LptC [Sedimentisphaerales bacterium]